MLTGYSLIYFAPGKWDGLWRNRQQLMSLFARQNKVLFVEGRSYLRSMPVRFRQGELGLSDLFWSPSLRQTSENLYVFRYPLWAPISGRTPLAQFTRAVRRIALRHILRRLRMSQPIVWLSRPDMIDLIEEIPAARLRLYHVVDEYSAYGNLAPEKRRRCEEQEKEMLARADAVVVVSQNLYEAKRPYNPHTYLVPNGVNHQAYAAALADPHLPDDLRDIGCPRLGYIGLIGDRLDLGMLQDLAEKHPEWSLVLLGEARIVQQVDIWEALRALPNVHYLGAVHASQVPSYVKGFQVGLMPYLQNRHAYYISPLKLYDYLAAGLPVASIAIPAVREFEALVHLADGPQNFDQAVQAALTDTTAERIQARKSAAAQHTWEVRAEQLSQIIEQQLLGSF
jgi:glycosyltransferase involved in cell wall biosynthesis